jgi:hypothetical protein
VVSKLAKDNKQIAAFGSVETWGWAMEVADFGNN